MKRRNDLLDRVTVSEPCREDWNEMRGNAEVRFCTHCVKSVHNLSAMTRRDAERLIAKSNGRICVRYVTRADRTAVTAPETLQPLFNITRRASRLITGAFTAALTITSAAAQSTVTTNELTNDEAVVNQANAPQIGSGNAAIVGTVVDPAEAVIAGAKVTLTDAAGAIRTTETSEEGVYHLDNLPGGTFNLEIESPGFKFHKVENLSLFGSGEQRINATLEVGEILSLSGAVMISSPAQPFVTHSEEREKIGERPEASEEVQSFLSEASDVDAKGLRSMIRDGANVHAANEWSETALMLAARWGSVKAVKALLKAGADVNARDNFGVTPLMYAMLAYDGKTAQMLIDAGADVNARDKDNRTALMFAAMEGRTGTIKILLTAGADVDARDVDGKTALRFAIENNREETVKVLRAAGAVE